MRRWIPLAFLASAAVPGWANSAPPFTCTANVGVALGNAIVPLVRSEGITELLGDIVLTCTGGAPTPKGQPIPTGTLSMTLNTQVTSRLINHSGQSEASLVIDEPGSATNPAPFTLFTNPICQVISNGTGTNNFDGSSGRPNVYSGTVSGNTVTFFGVPVAPPNPNGPTRIFRITNVRANVAQLSSGGSQASIDQDLKDLIAYVVFNQPNGAQIPITFEKYPPNSPIPVGLVAPATSFQVGYNPTTVTPDQVPFTIYLGAQEPFNGAWKSISPAATTTNPTLVPLTTDLPFDLDGTIAEGHSESGPLVMPNPYGGPMIGAADHGTIIDVTLTLPVGASATMPAQFPLSSGSQTNGTLLWSAPGATPSGSNITATAGPAGTIVFSGLVAQVQPSDSQNGFVLPIIINGPFPQVPYNIQAAVSYNYSQPWYQTEEFSSQFPGIPAFNETNLDGSQPLNNDVVGSVVASTTAPGDLSFLIDGQAGSVDSIELSGANAGASASPYQIALPLGMDLSIISSGAPVTGISVVQDPNAKWFNLVQNQDTTPATVSLSFDPNATPGNYSTNLTVTSPNLSTPLQIPVSYTSFSGPWFTKWGFTNAASNVANVVAPGMVFTINGFNFAPKTPATVNPSSGQAPTILGGTQVLFDGQPARLSAAFLAEANTTIKFEREAAQNTSSASVVIGFAPYGLSGKTTTQVQVVYKGVKSPPVTLTVLDAVPGVFTVNSNGTGQGMILNADSTMNSDSDRAPRGSIVTVLGTGFGLITPPGGDGTITGSPAPKIDLPVKVYLDGAVVTSSTRAESKNYDEVDAIRVLIPETARANADLPLMIQIGDKVSQPGVTVAVK